MTTLSERWAQYGHRTTGFDYMRLVLALAVVGWHSFGLTQGRAALDEKLAHTLIAVPVHLILPMFFALSGFLVTASLIRANSLRVYLAFRGLRLFPALAVEVLLAAVVLGPLVSTFAFGRYFTDMLFPKYFLNILGLVQYRLPGAFLDNPYPAVVNGSIWTVPFELECYFYLVIAFACGAVRNRWVLTIAFVLVTALVVGLDFTSAKGLLIAVKEYAIGKSAVNANLQEATTNPIEVSRILVSSFFAGGFLYVWSDRIAFSNLLALVCAILSVGLLASPDLYLFSPLPVAYLTVWLGLQNPPRNVLTHSGDYSYGIYLYSFPIQQTLSLSAVVAGSYTLHLAASILVASTFAFFSWHFVEKPCLGLKRHFGSRPPRASTTGGDRPSSPVQERSTP